MKFKLGDYVKHKEYPKSKVVFRLSIVEYLEIVNAQAENFEHATEREIESYHEDD